MQACIIISKKAQLPNNAKKWRQNFILTEEESKLAFTLPHKVSFESLTIQNFKFDTLYKQEIIANWILWAWWMHFLWQRIRNITPPFFLLHLLEYLLETSRKLLFRNNKQSYGSQPSKYHYRYYNLLLNYLILIRKIHIWDCRRTHEHPNTESFKLKVKIYYQTEKNIASTNKDLETFYKNWIKNFPL